MRNSIIGYIAQKQQEARTTSVKIQVNKLIESLNYPHSDVIDEIEKIIELGQLNGRLDTTYQELILEIY